MPKKIPAPKNEAIAAHKKAVAKAENRVKEAKAALAQAQKGGNS